MKNAEQHANDTDLELYLREQTLKFLEDHNKRTYQDMESLDAKARANIGAATLFLSFGAAFQLTAISGNFPALYAILLIVGLILYGAMIVFSLTVILPVEYHWPVSPIWENVTFYWTLPDKRSYIEQIISDYTRAIQLNRKAVDKKARNYRISGFVFGLIIIDLVIMTVVKLVM